MSVVESAADRMPDRLRPLARRWFYLLHPGLSWAKRRQVDRATDEFAARLLGGRESYESYRQEFLDGRIGRICRAGQERLPDGESVFDAHRDECAKLYALLREREPETVVESGVYHGVSTAALLLALDANGRGSLHSLAPSPCLDDPDAPADEVDRLERHLRRERPSCAEAGSHRLPGDREPGWILPDDLRDRWDLTVGLPSRRLQEVLADAGDVDVFLHDSVHSTTGMLFEFALAWEHLVPGGVLVSPHVDWNDAFETFVAERDCEHGLVSFAYNGLEGYEAPCRCGYAVKPGGGP